MIPLCTWNDLDRQAQKDALSRPALSQDNSLAIKALEIIDTVRQGGDQALVDYTRKFDGVTLESLRVTDAEFEAASNHIDDESKAAIHMAYQTISAFHKEQIRLSLSVETLQGVQCGRVIRPIDRVGLYVPGGSAPLISTTLMLGVPSQIAGNTTRILCTPPQKDGAINPHILYAAQLCGINEIYKIGGAQSIAAMAYGTESISGVDKIFGPGNAWVTAAKQIVSKDPQGAALDMPAGPSEVCVIATKDTPPAFAASDLLAQAEHDPLSQVVLIATDESVAHAILEETKNQLLSLSRRAIAASALQNSKAIVAADLDQALQIANLYAPEHLILCFEGAESCIPSITTAGSVFCGIWTPESVGDYASGTNHVLPTYGYARSYSGLSLDAFQRTMTVQSLSKAGLETLAPTVTKLAELEGLDAHAKSVTLRLKEQKS